jgi:hypothetical protein
MPITSTISAMLVQMPVFFAVGSQYMIFFVLKPSNFYGKKRLSVRSIEREKANAFSLARCMENPRIRSLRIAGLPLEFETFI